MKQQSSEVQDFTYGAAEDPSGTPARVSIFSDCASSRHEIEGDLDARSGLKRRGALKGGSRAQAPR